MRSHCGPWAYSRPIVKTEYQDMFLPPRSFPASLWAAQNKYQYRPQQKTVKNKEDSGLRASSADDNRRTRTEGMPSLRSVYSAQIGGNHPPKLPPVTSSNPMSPKKCSCARLCSACSKDYNLTTYKRDYQEWKLSMHQPNKHQDYNINVYQGIGADESKARLPIEGTTSYKSYFIPHPLLPRKNQDKPHFQTSSFQLGQTTPSFCGHCTGPCKHTVSHSCSPDKYKGDRFHTTMQSDFIEHKLQRRKPVIPAQTEERSKEPFEGTTTMRDDFRHWDLPRRPSKDTRKDWRKGSDQISFSEANRCQRCHTNLKGSDKTLGNSSAEFGSLAGNLPRSANGTTTWKKSNMDKDQAQMVNGMVPARN